MNNSICLDYSNRSGSNDTVYNINVHSVAELFVILFPGIFLNSLVTVLVATEKKLAKPVRLVLINILIACVFNGVAGVMIDIADAIISSNPSVQHALYFCHYFTWHLQTGGGCRTLSMATFAVVVYRIVRGGIRLIKTKWLVLELGTIWIIAGLFNMAVFSEAVLDVKLVKGFACSLGIHDHVIAYVYTALYCLLFGLIPYIITIAIPVVSFCQIKRNSITEDTHNQKALLKFCLFLLIGNTMNFIGQIVPIIVVVIAPKVDAGEVVLILEGTLLYLSLLPTPLIIIIYFRAIRQKVVRLMKCKRKARSNLFRQQERANRTIMATRADLIMTL